MSLSSSVTSSGLYVPNMVRLPEQPYFPAAAFAQRGREVPRGLLDSRRIRGIRQNDRDIDGQKVVEMPCSALR